MYSRKKCYKTGVNHLKKSFLEILKNFGLSKPKKNVDEKATFLKKMLPKKTTFSTNVDQSTYNFFYKNNVLVYVVSSLERNFDITARKKVKDN